jgi:hypothetical protein
MSKRQKLADLRDRVGQSSTPIHIDTQQLERVETPFLDGQEDVIAFWIPVADIEPSPYQYRYEVDEISLGALAESIAAQELYQPITVRPLDVGRYQVVLGHRRLAAFGLLGRERIPAIIRHYSDAQAVRALLDENLRRDDVNLFEQTEGVVRLVALELGLLGDPVKSVREVLEQMRSLKRSGMIGDWPEQRQQRASRLILEVTGITWESFLMNRLSVYRLPDFLQQAVRSGLPYYLAVALGRAPTRVQRPALAALERHDGRWGSQQELKDWLLANLDPQPKKPLEPKRFRQLANVFKTKPPSPDREAQILALVEEIERLLSPNLSASLSTAANSEQASNEAANGDPDSGPG